MADDREFTRQLMGAQFILAFASGVNSAAGLAHQVIHDTFQTLLS
jgi:hypothetical protein